eukprot:CAMPEP_0168602710 /NCGR_PEP_ID=MMETSP0420-20121227/14271_1 /TAXON_ID=498008 /ORGANISM="Pessonella sp." /LENGTH=162 /DNA_ID=CAMNT_0008641503 /DNA_START=200 /DNA_END=685 /DNA_ORIENTATION=+
MFPELRLHAFMNTVALRDAETALRDVIESDLQRHSDPQRLFRAAKLFRTLAMTFLGMGENNPLARIIVENDSLFSTLFDAIEQTDDDLIAYDLFSVLHYCSFADLMTLRTFIQHEKVIDVAKTEGIVSSSFSVLRAALRFYSTPLSVLLDDNQLNFLDLDIS